MSSTPAWYIGQAGAEGFLYLQVARIFISTRSLVKILRISCFFITDRYALCIDLNTQIDSMHSYYFSMSVETGHLIFEQIYYQSLA